jgi:hypothetical protein
VENFRLVGQAVKEASGVAQVLASPLLLLIVVAILILIESDGKEEPRIRMKRNWFAGSI